MENKRYLQKIKQTKITVWYYLYFFCLIVHHKIEDLNVEFVWERVRLFDEHFCRVLYERCQENPTAFVLKVTKRTKSKWRPVPLDTIVSNLNIISLSVNRLY